MRGIWGVYNAWNGGSISPELLSRLVGALPEGEPARAAHAIWDAL
jgi:hypothetical protein